MSGEKWCPLYVLHKDEPFGAIRCRKDLEQYDGKIIECKYENKQWVFMRERTDKSFPNAFNTARGKTSYHILIPTH